MTWPEHAAVVREIAPGVWGMEICDLTTGEPIDAVELDLPEHPDALQITGALECPKGWTSRHWWSCADGVRWVLPILPVADSDVA